MWNKFMQWHRRVESAYLDILDDPARAEALPSGPWQCAFQKKLAKMPPVQRHQLRGFVLKYSGWQGFNVLASGILVFTLVALLVCLTEPEKGLLLTIVRTNIVGFGVLAAALVGWFSYGSTVRRTVYLVAGLFILGSVDTLIGAVARSYQRGTPLMGLIGEEGIQLLLGICLGGTVVALPMVIVAMVRSQRHRADRDRLKQKAEGERAARELSESRLRVLHAQIEPHFLFNTLGSVQQLAERDAPQAAALTAHLIDFLRASMAQMRSETETLYNDFALVEAYLQVMSVRLGKRLRYAMNLPQALREVAMPSMMLLTLVENAIKHGIEPSLRGGELHISAEQRGSSVRICVRDTGVGLSADPGAGEGLDNVRKRLQLIYPGASSLTIDSAAGGGVEAAITIPLPLPLPGGAA